MVAPTHSKPTKLPGESEADYQKRLKSVTDKSTNKTSTKTPTDEVQDTNNPSVTP